MMLSIDASHLACPMPLLLAKQALRKHPEAEGVQVTTADPASLRDFGVYAKHAQLQLVHETRGELMILTLTPLAAA